MFYPDDPTQLRTMIDGLLEGGPTAGSPPKALIVPHAGYVYSGPVAASAYRHLIPVAQRIKRVILLGPSHRVALHGLAAPTAKAFRTPLGEVPVDTNSIASVAALPQVGYQDAAHALEHSLEVHLPFLQTILGTFKLVPLVVGNASAEAVAEVLSLLWGGDETLIVISTDLSHYHDHTTAQTLDRRTCDAIEHLAFDRIHYDNACGRNPLNGLLYLAREKGLEITTLDLRNSGDTAGPADQVVGYGAWLVSESDGESRHVAR